MPHYDPLDVMRRTIVNPLSRGDLELVDEMKQAGQLLHDMLDAHEPSREMSIAKTKLEEAIMWAVKGITA